MRVCNSVLIDPDLHDSDTDWLGWNPSWYYSDEGFNQKEVDKIKQLKDVYTFKRGTTFGKSSETTDSNTRESEIFWIQENRETEWIYNRISWHVNKANREQWRFELHSMEQIQYSRYVGSDVLTIKDKLGLRSHRDNNQQDGHYDWHTDIGKGGRSNRKISVVVQLVNKRKYSGGKLLTWDGNGEIQHGQAEGSIVIFPSFILHKVTPVTTGTRESLVVWCHGPTFR